MRSIRNNVFETNSSSTHSLSIKRNKTGKYDYNLNMNNMGKIPLIFGRNSDFGWGEAVYNDSYTKLNYLACMAFECHCQLLARNKRELIKNMEDVLKIKDIQKLANELKKNVKGFTGFTLNKVDFGAFQGGNYAGVLYLVNSIDHQSWEDYKSIDDFLKRYKITLENFLFNPSVKLVIGNDNESSYDYF